MNKTFKVVFNRARGVLMVANEITSSVQKKGTKTVVAAAVASAMSCGVAVAEEFHYEQTTGNSGRFVTTTEESAKTFAKDDVLLMDIAGTNTRAYGLLASGKDHKYTNEGVIKVNINATENKTPYWQVKGMMAERGGTVVNAGTIEVTDAYGMTVGSLQAGETNTIINDGTINVNGGAAMEAAPTGTFSSEKTAQAVATNNGTINVTSGIGVVVSGDNGVITNNGTIDASAGDYAVLVHREKDHTTSGNAITFTEKSVTKGAIVVTGYTVKEDGKDKTYKVENTTLEFKDGAIHEGRIVISKASGTKLSGYLNISNQKGTTGAALFFGDAEGSIDLKNSQFTNNIAAGVDEYGGAIYTYGIPFKQTGGQYVGNCVQSTGADKSEATTGIYEPYAGRQGAAGGAIMMKGNGNSVLTDVLFENNSVVSKKTETTAGGYAYGGAVMVDYSTGTATGVKNPTDVEFHLTKDMTYSGNTVHSDSTQTAFDTYGYHVDYAQAGGFLFLDRGSSAKFNIDADATLTIGSQVTSDDTDSIASSIPNTNLNQDPSKLTNEGKHANLIKEGEGQLVINSSLNKYYGNVAVNEGRMEVNSKWDVKNAVNIATGATLALADFNLIDADKTNNQDVKGDKLGGKLTVSGTLETSSDQVFTQDLGADGLAETAGALVYSDDKLKFESGSTLALSDALYNLKYAESAGDVVSGSGSRVVMLGDLVNKGEVDNSQTLEELKDVGPNVELNKVTVVAENKNIQIGGNAPTTGNDTSYRAESLSVGSVDLGTAEIVTIDGGKILSLAGNGGEVIASTSVNDVTVEVKSDSTLALGGAASNGGTVSATVNVNEGAEVVVTGSEDFTIETVTGKGTVLVGTNETAGKLVIKSLEGMTGTLFVDPAWKDNAALDVVGNASHLEISDVGTAGLTASVVAGQNSLVSFGATADTAAQAFESIASAQGLSWGRDNITAAVYVDGTLALDETTGGILVKGSLTAAEPVTAGTVTVVENGMLIVNQANAGDAVIRGAVDLDQGSYLGVINASEGQFNLATGDVVADGASVVTDNPFIDGAIDGNTVTTTLNEEAGLGSLASTGIQAMTRHADFIMAETIADRTSIDQELNPGMNLWANVTGERYESTSMDNGGTFKSDMGYGAFGAEVPVTDTVTAGAAIQYGKGSLRSGVASIKNDIDNYGFTAYATKSFGAAKVVGELAYLQSKNDITSSQAAMNQEVDAKIYSAGIRAQYQLTTDHFQFVPSIGIRVSQLETDAMDVGAVKVKEQEQTLVQVPIALRINGFEQSAADGWTLAPSFKVAFVPTFGDEEISVLSHDQDVIDTTPVSADFGLRAKKGNMMVDANFMVGGGKDGTSSVGGKIGMKYVF